MHHSQLTIALVLPYLLAGCAAPKPHPIAILPPPPMPASEPPLKIPRRPVAPPERATAPWSGIKVDEDLVPVMGQQGALKLF